jgi:glycosyltransferase involved in cell wall biosynthesis
MATHQPPTLTVVIPTYKRHTLLMIAVASALAQRDVDLEVVVTVDGDDERGAEVAASFSDSRVRVLWDGRKRGEALNTIRGIQGGSAPFFAILHDDDIWLDDLARTLIEPLVSDETVSVSFADHVIIDEHGNVDDLASSENSRHYGREALAAGRHQPFYSLALIDQSIPAVMTAVYRRAHVPLRDTPADLEVNFDLWLAWLAAKGGTAAYFTPRVLSQYRVHSASITGSSSPQGGTATGQLAWAHAGVQMNRLFLQELELVAYHETFRRRLASSQRRLAILMKAQKTPGAIGQALQSLRTKLTFKGLVTLVIVLGPRSLRKSE